jgi:hypothetical protein
VAVARFDNPVLHIVVCDNMAKCHETVQLKGPAARLICIQVLLAKTYHHSTVS